MSCWRDRLALRRCILLLVVVAFLPLAGAAAGCQVACLVLSVAAQSADHHTAQDSRASVHAVLPQHSADHLQHAGPCRLTVTPSLLSDVTTAPLLPGHVRWTATAFTAFASLEWPPPRHRPRA
jgi:hypothetical protein